MSFGCGFNLCDVCDTWNIFARVQDPRGALGPRTICHIFMLCWRVSSGVSQPRSTRISAVAVARFRSRMEPGPNRQISRTRTAGWGQRFTSQSSIFSVGEDWGAAGGTIGCSNGPLGIVSTCRSFSRFSASWRCCPNLSKMSFATAVILLRACREYWQAIRLAARRQRC